MNQPRFLMCPPPHFGVEYIINPWMKGQIHATDANRAIHQWEALQQLLSDEAEVCLMQPAKGLPDLVFTANAALIHRNCAILSNFRCEERRPEAAHFAEWLKAAGFELTYLPENIFFEGAGDALFDRARPLLWFGYGFRSDLAAKPHLQSATGCTVQELRLCDPRFYHLDTCFCPLESGFLLYYPGAFDAEGLAVIETRVPSSQRLAVSEADAIHFACNAVNVGWKIILNDLSMPATHWLEERGFEVIKTRMYEFMKAGGSAKCLSLRLDEN